MKEIFKLILHWRKFKIKSVCKSNFSLEGKKRIDAKTILKSLRRENTNKLVFADININSLRNKFELLVDQVKGNIDDLMISETKIDVSFSLGN